MKKVLVAPLDWGLGHATRCIPIIHALIKRDCIVYIAGAGDSLALLKDEFPHLAFFTLPGYEPAYPSNGSMLIKMISQIPKFIRTIDQEHRETESIVQNNGIDLIVSDNRYGCWSANIPSIFVTHQLNILMPEGWRWMSTTVNGLNRRLIRKFWRCWIPDYENKEICLAGSLSDFGGSTLDKVAYIGPLSRFEPVTVSTDKYDVVCIFSGPEPQRSIFESMILSQLKSTSLRYFIAKGKLPATHPGDISYANSQTLQNVISQSSLVIARSGYSTIMDMAKLGKKGIVVPTPGQTEQEYLAQRWSEKGVLYSMPQKSFNLNLAMKESARYTGFIKNGSRSAELLEQELDSVLAAFN